MRTRLLGCLLLLFVAEARAHRLDECLQAIRIAVSSDRIELTFALTPGVEVADQLLAVLDTNRDGQISSREGRRYVNRVLRDLRVAVDDKSLVLRADKPAFPPIQEIKAGAGVIGFKAGAVIKRLSPGHHTLSLTNVHLPDLSVYLVNALVPKDPSIQIASQDRNDAQTGYLLKFVAGRSR